MRIWRVAEGKELAILQHGAGILAVLFSPDGRHLASASADHTGRVWDMTSYREVARMVRENVLAVTFSPEGRYLATASADGTARLWEVGGQREVTRVTLNEPVTAVAFSPDGRHFVTGEGKGTARVWLWHPEDLIEAACARLTVELTADEWRRYLPNEPQRQPCRAVQTSKKLRR